MPNMISENKKQREKEKYADIINLPHHVSAVHPHMSLLERAAQFAPFSALSGHGEAIRETARQTNERREPDEDLLAALNEKLQMLMERMEEHPAVEITYFVPDSKKEGGAYVTVSGNVKRLDEFENCICLTDGRSIPLNEIIAIC